MSSTTLDHSADASYNPLECLSKPSFESSDLPVIILFVYHTICTDHRAYAKRILSNVIKGHDSIADIWSLWRPGDEEWLRSNLRRDGDGWLLDGYDWREAREGYRRRVNRMAGRGVPDLWPASVKERIWKADTPTRPSTSSSAFPAASTSGFARQAICWPPWDSRSNHLLDSSQPFQIVVTHVRSGLAQRHLGQPSSPGYTIIMTTVSSSRCVMTKIFFHRMKTGGFLAMHAGRSVKGFPLAPCHGFWIQSIIDGPVSATETVTVLFPASALSLTTQTQPFRSIFPRLSMSSKTKRFISQIHNMTLMSTGFPQSGGPQSHHRHPPFVSQSIPWTTWVDLRETFKLLSVQSYGSGLKVGASGMVHILQ
ncbi:hypothetical protein JAAARDRAFT_488503 [Jaapia argillacea MUCL 33604]|uniref:Uncharacterized protein n=1 Tax=Jaapia argillacea MUCL 33604 TaxID=933084 RepID=A0A067PPR8_9AGAM|nr:hypothetical protein JAAARDRAFT_488503 [Jaapia argillacea MUCL 33604]